MTWASISRARSRQPEAVTAGLEGDCNPFDPMSCLLRLLPPAIEQFQQRALIDRELLQRRALDARHDTGDQPTRLTCIAAAKQWMTARGAAVEQDRNERIDISGSFP